MMISKNELLTTDYDDEFNKYFKISYTPELSSYLISMKKPDAIEIEGFIANYVMFKCKNPTLRIKPHDKTSLVDIYISAKGDYSPSIHIQTTTNELPIELSISKFDGTYLNIVI